MRSTKAWLLFGPLLATVAAAREPLPGDSSGWHGVETPGFSVTSNAGPDRARQIAIELESFRASLRELLPQLRHDRLRRPAVYACDSRKTLRRYYPEAPRGVTGVFVQDEWTDFILIDAGSSTREQHLFHEYLHQVLRESFHVLPAWLNEGLAYYFQTFRRVDDHVEVGGEVPGLPRVGKVSLSHTLSTYAGAPGYDSMDFAAEAWLLVHYLMSRADAEREQAARVLSAIAAGEDSRVALESAFGVSIAVLEARLAAYAAQDAGTPRRIEVAPRGFDEEPTISALSPAESLARLGELVAVASRDPLAAAPWFAAALAADPELVRGQVGLAAVLSAQGNFAEARRLLEQAAVAEPRSARILFVRGRVALGEFAAWRRSRPDGAPQDLHPSLLDARESFRRAMELDPSRDASANRFAHTYLFDPRTRQPGIEVCELRLVNGPRLDLALTLVRLYSDDANPVAAHRARERYLMPLRAMFGGHGDGDRVTPWDRIERSLVEADVLLAERLYEAGRLEEALEVLGAARTRAPEPLREDIDGRIERFTEVPETLAHPGT